MKKAIFFLLAALFLFLNCLPSTIIFANDSGYTNSQLADVGTLMLSSLISSGEATELDFSDYTENDGLDFLVALGKLAVTGDPSGLIDQGLSWLGGELDDAYQSLIEDIRAWEHDIAPDLYDWWYNGTQYEYKLIPNTNISRPLKNLLRDNNSLIPNPDPNYSQYLDYINGSGFWWKDWENLTPANGYGLYVYPPILSSWCILDGWTFIPYINQNTYVYTIAYSQILTLNITSVSDVYYLDYSVFFDHNLGSYNYNNWGNKPANYGRIEGNNLRWAGNNQNDYEAHWSTSGTLTQVLEYISNRFRNVNLYVDGNPWSIISSDTAPIVIPGALTVLNNQPVQYTFNNPTYYDINGLKTLITNAINSSDVLTWQDIDDYFLDINGQQAFPVVQIYRNDYDNMYIEQYPYPAKLIGMQDPLTFNEHMLDNYYGQYLTPMVDVASNTVDVLPGEIKWVLGIGAILMIFAVIINRLLE